MCGIAGIFHLTTPKPVDPSRVERMCAAMAHRGPDGQGVWTAPGVGLGHLRLSIIDLAGSPQPMASTDGRAMLAGLVQQASDHHNSMAAGFDKSIDFQPFGNYYLKYLYDHFLLLF